jgi:hypothetical protein
VGKTAAMFAIAAVFFINLLTGEYFIPALEPIIPASCARGITQRSE